MDPVLRVPCLVLAAVGAVALRAPRAQGYPIQEVRGAGGELLGTSVAGAGDLDGDGRADLIVGAPLAAPGGLVNAGQARVYSGATGALLRTIDGTTAHGQLGSAVAQVGDLDLDGIPDLAVGAPIGAAGGQVKLVSGRTGALLFTLSGTGQYGGELFGLAVAGAGDVDGDGRPDVLVGSPYWDWGSFLNVGRAWLFSGRDATLLRFFNPFGNLNQNDNCGQAFAAAGDVDGDGRPDLLVGSPGSDPSGTQIDGGQFALYSGAGNNPPMFYAYGSTGSRVGYALASIGDVDADGRPDFLVGHGASGQGGRVLLYRCRDPRPAAAAALNCARPWSARRGRRMTS